ncbi:MAG: sensor domain-containing diguanylate cyclase [Stagnimonas sp.]|nr:sensor domain-containing diguanylate cyclase [Stagnimonas sp.]
MSATLDGPERLRRARSRALLAGLPLLGAVWAAGGLIVGFSPRAPEWEAGLYLGGAAIFWLLIVPAHAAIKAEDALRQERIAMFALWLSLLLILVRLVLVLFVAAVADPALSIFRPAYAFMPVLYICGFLLLPARRALWLSWLLGGLLLVVTLGAVFINDWGWDRTGLPETLQWLLLGNPLFLCALHALPAMEDALHHSAREVSDLRERARLSEQISTSERRFNLVVDSLQVGVWDQRFEAGELVEHWWSPRYYELLGYRPEQLPPSEAGAQQLFGESYLLVRSALYAQLRERNGIAAVDTRLLTRERGWRWFNISAKAEFDAQRRFSRITGAIEDIHEQRVAEESLLEAQAELAKLAYRDALTGLPNRRAFEEQLRREWDRARRVGQSLSLLAIDLDWFKAYNDRYGHPAGDEYLRLAAACFSQCLRRPADLAARVGGEEFFVLLPDTDSAGARGVAETIERTLRQLAVPHQDSPFGVVTCSVGISSGRPSEGGAVEALVQAADSALYQSKHEGRARVSVAPQLA